MIDPRRCDRCGHAVEAVRKPVRRLRWTRLWWQGFKSLFGRPLQSCPQCGAVYGSNGELLAAGAIETAAERRLNLYRRDMAALRDSFAGVVIAAEVVIIYLVGGAEGVAVGKVLLAAGVGAGALANTFYFGRKARLAKRDLKRMRTARRSGEIPSGTGRAPG